MRFAVATIAVALTTSATAQPNAPIQGYWKNPIGSAIIAIAPCGRVLCGRVAWASARGQREVAKNTPNVVGTMVLTNLQPSGGRWSGALYVPDDNIHVAARLQLQGRDRLQLTGCAFMGLICRSQVWTRVERLPRAGE